LEGGAVPCIVAIIDVTSLIILTRVKLDFGNRVVSAIDEAGAVEEVEGTSHVWTY
jgi:hypothetical protein